MSVFVDKWPNAAFFDSNPFGLDSFHTLGGGFRSSLFSGQTKDDSNDSRSEPDMKIRNYSPLSASAGRGFYDDFDSAFHGMKSRRGGGSSDRRHYDVVGRDATRQSTSAKGKEFVIPIRIETSSSSRSPDCCSSARSPRSQAEKEQPTSHASSYGSRSTLRTSGHSGRSSSGRVIHIPIVREDSTHGPDHVNSMWSKKSRAPPVWTPTTDEDKSRHCKTSGSAKDDDDIIYLDSDFFFPDSPKPRQTALRYRNASHDSKYADYSDYDIIEIEEQEEETVTSSMCRKPLRHINNDTATEVTSPRNLTSSSSEYQKKTSPNAAAEVSTSSRNDAALRRDDAEREESKASELDEGPSKRREPWLCSHSGVTDVATPPSYPIYAHLKPRLASIGRQVDYIRGDGNCFFRALSKEMYGSEDYHTEWRQAVCDVIADHPHVFAQYIDDSSVAKHAREMRQPGTWATTCEIYATASLLQREIYVLVPAPTKTLAAEAGAAVTMDGEEPAAVEAGVCEYHWLLFSPRCLTGSSAGGSLSRLDKESGSRGGGIGRHDDEVHPCYLTLCHTNGNHYDRIIPVFARCNCEIAPPGLNGVSVLLDLTTSDEEELMQQ